MITALLPVLGTLIERLIPDKAQASKVQAEIELQLTQAANQVALETIKTNQTEAQHRSVFVAGWRPALGWTCAAGFAWAFIGEPLARWALVLQGIDVQLPELQTEYLLEMTFAMLGLGGLRTFEKLKGVTR